MSEYTLSQVSPTDKTTLAEIDALLQKEGIRDIRIAYGTVVQEIKEVSRSYKEAKMALEVGKIFHTCPDTCPCHEKLIRNMLMVMAKKNLELSRRSLHTAPKSIRGRLISYFSQEMVQQGSSQFMIPFNRQELADYLGVDRSALSNELGKMRKEGIIEVNRNQIHYLESV